MTHDHDALPQPPSDTPTDTAGGGANTDEDAARPGDLDLNVGGVGGVGAAVDHGVDELALFALLEQVATQSGAPVDHGAADQGALTDATGRHVQPTSNRQGRADWLPALLAGLVAARALGGQRLADALAMGATDDLHDALVDALLDRTDERPADEAPDERSGLHASRAPAASTPGAIPATSAGLGRLPAAQLSPGAQRALAHIFGAAPTGDGSFYAQRPTPPARRVAEAHETYQIDGEHPQQNPDEEQ